jgi:hypothetical protein
LKKIPQSVKLTIVYLKVVVQPVNIRCTPHLCRKDFTLIF